MTHLGYPQQVSLAHAPPLLSFPISANADRHEVFRYPDRSGIQASFPVSRPKWHSGQCSDVQIEEVSDDQVDATYGVQARFPIFRSKWHSGQFSDVQIEVISSIQTDERHSGHGYFCVTIYFGIQFNILFRYSNWLSPYQTNSSFKTTSLPILTDIVTSLHFSANFWAFIVFNPLIPRKCESRCYLLFGSPVDWIGAAVIPQNLPFIFPEKKKTKK